MKKVVLVLLALYASNNIIAADYPVSGIPKTLTENANAVIRLEEQTVELFGINKVVTKKHYVITILNEAGDKYAFWGEGYDKLNSVDHIDGVLYDADGKKLRSMKKSEIVDRSATSDMNLADDSRVKYHSFYHKDYPYTVEYECISTSYITMFLPEWSPIPGRNVAVEKSTFTVISDKDIDYRLKPNHLIKSPKIDDSGKRKVTQWQVSQQPAILAEYASPPLHEIAPYLILAPNRFRLGDFEGSMNTWQEYGRFMLKINEGLDVLPASVKQKVHEIVGGAGNDREKVTRLYRYLQQNSHYISIQLGIGGWRPLPAKFVAEKGYGDCKALSNYMIALLKEAGIKANYVIIRAGENEMDLSVEFPYKNSNHVICAVPLAKDTIWLECTSQDKAAGYMGSFTGNRHALMITEDGGKVVKTPSYSKADNSITSNLAATLDAAGKMTVNVVNRYQACTSDDIRQMIHELSKEDQLKYLKRSIDIAHYDVTQFSHEEINDKRLPVIIESISINAPTYAQVTGKRLFVVPNITNKWDTKLPADTARMYDIVLKNEQLETDTVSIELPVGFRAETLTKPADIKTPFGWYRSSASITGNKLVYIRRLEINKGRFPAKDYQSLVKFYEDIYKADRAKVVLVKSE